MAQTPVPEGSVAAMSSGSLAAFIFAYGVALWLGLYLLGKDPRSPRLALRTGADFGTSDEWRYYNALYFPYVIGLKPYSNRNRTGRKDPVAREALDWFRNAVPERTLYNWQTVAAKLVARDLLSRSGPNVK